MLIFSFVFLAVGVVCWALVVHDDYIAEMWNSSYCLLSPGVGDVVSLIAIACVIVGSLLGGWRAISRRSRRAVAIASLVLNLSAPFIAYWSARYLTHVAQKAREEWISSRRSP